MNQCKKGNGHSILASMTLSGWKKDEKKEDQTSEKEETIKISIPAKDSQKQTTYHKHPPHGQYQCKPTSLSTQGS